MTDFTSSKSRLITSFFVLPARSLRLSHFSATSAAFFSSNAVVETTPLSSSTKAVRDFASSGLPESVCAIALKLETEHKSTKAIINFIQLILVSDVLFILFSLLNYFQLPPYREASLCLSIKRGLTERLAPPDAAHIRREGQMSLHVQHTVRGCGQPQRSQDISSLSK